MKLVFLFLITCLIAVSQPSATVTLTGKASDPDLPVTGVLVLEWSKVSGPGDVFFTDADKQTATARFTVPGVYVLQFKASDGEADTADTMQVTVNPANVAPIVDAGPDQTVKLAKLRSVTLSWNASSTPSVAGYFLYKSMDPSQRGSRLNETPVTVLNFVDLDVAAGNTYYYVATAFKDGLESVDSNQAVAVVGEV